MSRARTIPKRNFRNEVAAVLFEVLKNHRDEGLPINEVAQLVLKTGKLEAQFLDGIRAKAVQHYISQVAESKVFQTEYG